jgi:hypothetical protein
MSQKYSVSNLSDYQSVLFYLLYNRSYSDGKGFLRVKPPSVDELDPEQHELLRKKTLLDRKLYDAVLERFAYFCCFTILSFSYYSFIIVFRRNYFANWLKQG